MCSKSSDLQVFYFHIIKKKKKSSLSSTSKEVVPLLEPESESLSDENLCNNSNSRNSIIKSETSSLSSLIDDVKNLEVRKIDQDLNEKLKTSSPLASSSNLSTKVSKSDAENLRLWYNNNNNNNESSRKWHCSVITLYFIII